MAAAIVQRSGWLEDTDKPLIDPMCGSGTVLIEAVSMAAKQAPSIHREYWGFDSWLGHDDELWQAQMIDASEASKQGLDNFSIKVYGSDLDARVLKTAKQNARNAGFF